MSKSGEDVNTEAYIKEYIKRVRKWIHKLAYALFERGEIHDASKLREPEFSQWEAMDREPHYPYGSKEYKNSDKDKHIDIYV